MVDITFGGQPMQLLLGENTAETKRAATRAETAAGAAEDALAELEPAKDAALTAISGAQTTAVGAVNTAGDAKVTEVNAVGDDKIALATAQAERSEDAADVAVGAVASTTSLIATLNLSASLVALIASFGIAGADWSVAANAYEATAAAPAAMLTKPVKVLRLGFDANGAPAHYTDTLYAMTREAAFYPSTTSMSAPTWTAGSVALSDEIYSTDAIVPYAQNSANLASPKPTAAWMMPYRLVVGNTVHWEVAAWHRDGRNNRQVACVRVRAVDSSNSANATPWQTVSATAISTLCEDVNPVEVFRGDLTISGLPDNILFHLEAEVYPWIGGAASVLTTTGVTDPRKFGPRHFTRDTGRAANPPIVYVSPSGNDSTGVCSTNDATAAATPCLTVQGAITRAIAATGVTGGKVDGLRVRIAGTVAMGTHNGAIHRNQSSGAIIIERGTGTARASAIVQQSAAIGFNLGGTGFLNPLLTSAAVVFFDASYQRTAIGQIALGATGIMSNVQLWNTAFDNGNISGAWLVNGATSTLRTYGVAVTNYNGNFTYTTGHIQPLFRGLNCPTAIPEGTCIVGSYVAGAGTRLEPEKGFIFYANKVTEMSLANAVVSVNSTSAGQTVTDVVIVQNLFERRDASGTRTMNISGDGQNGGVVGAVIAHNVSTGYGLTGRWNVEYDESSGTNRRTHRYNRFIGNIVSQLNTKSAVFVATIQGSPSEAVNRHGNWPFAHGAGCAGNFAMFATQQPSSESQIYPGIGSNIGGSATSRNDPLFVSYAGTGGSGGTPSAGAGGGDYHLQADSPAKGIVPVAAFGFDYAGNARGSGAQDAGLYA